MPSRIIASSRGIASARGVAPPWYIEDFFTDPNATTLPNHSPDIDVLHGGWIAGAGAWEIDANEAKQTTGGAGATNAYIEAAVADCTVECVYQTGDGDDYGGICFRVEDADSNWEFFINPAQNNSYVGLNNNGARATQSTVGQALDALTEYTLRLVLSGDNIKAYVDGVLKHDFTHTFLQTATQHGLWMWTTDTFSRWDNFRVGRPR